MPKMAKLGLKFVLFHLFFHFLSFRSFEDGYPFLLLLFTLLLVLFKSFL
jgi:hypothetical protein